MVHELLLFGQVPEDQHDQVAKVLAGISGMQPNPISERHLILKPRRSTAQRPTHVGGSQGVQSPQVQNLLNLLKGELYYVQLVEDVRNQAFSRASAPPEAEHDKQDSSQNADPMDVDDDKKADGANAGDVKSCFNSAKHHWTLQFRDIPEVAGRRPVTTRLMMDVDFADGDPLQMLEDIGFNFVSEYLLKGTQFVFNNLILRLYRIHRIPNHPDKSRLSCTQMGPLTSLALFDPSGSYVLQASARVLDGSKPECMNIGVGELVTLRDMLRGLVNLDIGDRLALDTRSK